jgi:glyoxylase-like metal-dependent hydrolase (beta-lactamase superfamily II)
MMGLGWNSLQPMTIAHSFHVGGLRCFTLEGGRQRLDGGAMFGVVPKPLWSRRISPDERNRIPLALRCLLVEHPDGLVLIDTGLGNKEDPKFLDIYGVENRGSSGATQLEDSLLDIGYRPSEVKWVINTHLHFDHAGGNTAVRREAPTPDRSEDGSVGLAFPNATYVVQRQELEFARNTNERTRASYLSHNFDPVDAAGRWRLIDGNVEVLPGISVRSTPGHVPFHQSVVISDRDDVAVYLGDVMPTAAHLPLPWIMGYDLEPLRTLESKRALVKEAADRRWRFVFEHDPIVAFGRVVREGKDIALAEVVTAPLGPVPQVQP